MRAFGLIGELLDPFTEEEVTTGEVYIIGLRLRKPVQETIPTRYHG
jgi:hypothetical protein